MFRYFKTIVRSSTVKKSVSALQCFNLLIQVLSVCYSIRVSLSAKGKFYCCRLPLQAYKLKGLKPNLNEAMSLFFCVVDYPVFCGHVAPFRNQQIKQINLVLTKNGDHNWSASQLIIFAKK